MVDTHLHADHCGGNCVFPDRPVYVQRAGLDDALTPEGYTSPDWVQARGVQYIAVEDEVEIAPGARLLAAPGRTRGSQIVVIESDDRPVVIAGDAAVWAVELDELRTGGRLLIRALDFVTVWLSLEHEPWCRTTDVQ